MRKANTETENVMLGIHEVYYDENGKPSGWSESPRPIMEYNINGLSRMLKNMLEAVEKPVLDYESGAEISPD